MHQLELLPRMLSLDAIYKHGGFRNAALALRVSKASVSRHVDELEEILGVRLLERTTRRVRLTEEGKYLLDVFQEIQIRWEVAVETSQMSRTNPVGTVRISAPHIIASEVLPKVLTQFFVRFPGITVDIKSSDVMEDLVEEGIDVAFRAGPLSDSNLRRVKLLEAREVLVGAPSIVASMQSNPANMSRVPWIVHQALPVDNWKELRDATGRLVDFEPTQRIIARSSDVFVSLLRTGAGFGIMPDAFIRDDLEQGRLCVLPFRGRPATLYAVFVDRARAPARTMLVVEYIRAYFAR